VDALESKKGNVLLKLLKLLGEVTTHIYFLTIGRIQPIRATKDKRDKRT
jgi:hypothetical protein